jgi:hypothetical protein
MNMYSFHQGLHAKMVEKLRQEHCTLLVESLRSGFQPAKQRAAEADCHSAFTSYIWTTKTQAFNWWTIIMPHDSFIQFWNGSDIAWHTCSNSTFPGWLLGSRPLHYPEHKKSTRAMDSKCHWEFCHPTNPQRSWVFHTKNPIVHKEVRFVYTLTGKKGQWELRSVYWKIPGNQHLNRKEKAFKETSRVCQSKSTNDSVACNISNEIIVFLVVSYISYEEILCNKSLLGQPRKNKHLFGRPPLVW